MQLSLLAFAAVVVTGAAAQGCANAGQQGCTWEGTAPWCGADDLPIGTKKNGLTLVTNTKGETTRNDLLNNGVISPSCANDYGNGCTRGHKNLWCKYAPESTIRY
ncbi:hypothetical protein BDV25DRAFT_163267 [Aspergillus avenaceus]|uniref:Uncharacterized protein n=1 Tax=Aspergillus avenaceus TaxID=36643 RepID=A0A5N6TI77_ASPAV|nr:hypothetical protein BDV25DRAFT_163267 [Aspergillus avenaceus]